MHFRNFACCTIGALFGMAGLTLCLQVMASQSEVAPTSHTRFNLRRGAQAPGHRRLANEDPSASTVSPAATAERARRRVWRWQPGWSPSTQVDRSIFRGRVWEGLQASANVTADEATQALLDAAAQHNRTLAVVQVGACDGNWEATNDPVQALLRDERVQALVLEPVPTNFKELDKRLAALSGASRRLLALNAALCMEASDKPMPFFVVSERFARDHPDAQHWAKRELGSFLRSHLRKHHIPSEYIETIDVPCRTASQLFGVASSPVGEDPADVDALVIDAEGLDADLLEAFLAVEGFSPAVIVIEQKHLKRPKLEGVQSKLQRLGYSSWRDRDQLVALRSAPTGSLVL